jgi:transposase InsO family protein
MRHEDIQMSQRELQRYHLLRSVLDGKLTLMAAATALGISLRQARRLKGKVATHGARGVTHGNAGHAPAHTVPLALCAHVVTLSREHYSDANDSHFTELLATQEGIVLARATVARIRRAAGIAAKHKRRVRRKHYQRRERHAAVGAMLLWDGSTHRWFGATHPACCLTAAIDDASGRVVGGIFGPQECSVSYLRVLQQVVTTYGLPGSIYQDRHSALARTDAHWSLEEQLAGQQEPTQVGAALAALGITPIFALSPQAKGRVERLWGTLQDRLVVALRLAGVSTLEAANAYLPTFLAAHNAQFAVVPQQAAAVWRAPRGVDLERILAFRYQATVGRDNAVRLGGHLFDLPAGPRGLGYAGQRVEVRQLVDGRWRVYHQEHLLVEAPATAVVEPIRRYRRHPTARAAQEAVDLPDAPPTKPATSIRQTRGQGIRATRLA